MKKKISQFAGDISIILDGSEESLLETISTLHRLSDVSDLCINYLKTHSLWIDSKKYSNEILISNSELNWRTSKFTLPGINFDDDLLNMPSINYDSKLVKIKYILKQWEKTHLTPIGKISVIKTLLLPLLNHNLMSIPKPSPFYCKELKKLLFSFICNYSTHRIKRNVLDQKYEEGGL